MKKILFAAFYLGLWTVDCFAAPGRIAVSNSRTVAAATTRAPTTATVAQPETLNSELRTQNSEDCNALWADCMNGFCTSNNPDGGVCACSDKHTELEDQIKKIADQINNAEILTSVEVEKILAGADADIIFNAKREYDARGNVIGLDGAGLTPAEKRRRDRDANRANLLALFETNDTAFRAPSNNIADQAGQMLYDTAANLCREQMPTSCNSKMNMAEQTYSMKIKSDCNAFETSVKKMQDDANIKLASAEKSVRDARRTSLSESNEYDRGQCLIEFRSCMHTADTCGVNWELCVAGVAERNMQMSRTSNSSANRIMPASLERLNSKRNMCESVLDKCVLVRNYIWDDFLKDVGPDIRVAELRAESNMRTSCLTNISECIRNACRDDIATAGTYTMDACLTRPEMARNFCKVEIDPCEKMDSSIFGYVKDRLNSMRNVACRDSVQDSLNELCGENFEKCVGIDYTFVQNRLESQLKIGAFVPCQKSGSKFDIDELNVIANDIYLAIDTSAIENCENIIDEKTVDICGAEIGCPNLVFDENFGANSLQSVKDGDVYRITGMISWGAIKTLDDGRIDVADYINELRRKFKTPEDKGIVDNIEMELLSVQKKVNEAISVAEVDSNVQFCTVGRDMSQITGEERISQARFPNLLNTLRNQISTAALDAAQRNYSAKLNNAIADANKSADQDLKQYMCQMMSVQKDSGGIDTTGNTISSELIPPYAISFDIDVGLTTDKLASSAGGRVSQVGGSEYNLTKRTKVSVPSGERETWSVFNPTNNVCTVCNALSTQKCTTKGKRSWFGKKVEQDCGEIQRTEQCNEFQM